MTLYRHQFTMVSSDGIPANSITNTLYSLGVDDDDANEALGIFTVLIRALTSQLPAIVPNAGHTARTYNMDQPAPRYPIFTQEWVLSMTASGDPLPPEVALCLSFQAPQISGVPQARRRGRIYIGPVRETECDPVGRPTSVMTTRFATAATACLDSFEATASSDWAVHSSISGLAGGAVVTNGWVDNEFDIQRRRGRKATARVAWS